MGKIIQFKIKAYKVNKKKFQVLIAEKLLLEAHINPDSSVDISFINTEFKEVKLGKPTTLKQILKWDVYEAKYKFNQAWAEKFQKSIADLQAEATSISKALSIERLKRNI